MGMISLHIDDSLNAKLENFAASQERSKGYIVRKAIERYLEDQEDLALGLDALEEFKSSDKKTYTLKQIKDENGL
jgi:RHH-type rel operon transcriptional repressor/antitoxin RelB